MPTRPSVRIPRSLFNEMVEHVRATLPAEGCGLLAGQLGEYVVTTHFPLTNAIASPTEFESDGREMLAAHKAMRSAGAEIIAIYHSHPTSEPVPSRRDVERSYSEYVVNVIVGLAGTEADVRGWWIVGPDCVPAEIEIVEK